MTKSEITRTLIQMQIDYVKNFRKYFTEAMESSSSEVIMSLASKANASVEPLLQESLKNVPQEVLINILVQLLDTQYSLSLSRMTMKTIMAGVNPVESIIKLQEVLEKRLQEHDEKPITEPNLSLN